MCDEEQPIASLMQDTPNACKRKAESAAEDTPEKRERREEVKSEEAASNKKRGFAESPEPHDDALRSAKMIRKAAEPEDLDDYWADDLPGATDGSAAVVPPSVVARVPTPVQTKTSSVTEAKPAAVVEAPKPAKAPEIDPLKVFVGNLSYSVDEAQLELDFSDFGDVVHVNLKPEIGLAWIEFDSKEAATSALSKDGDEYWGRVLRVQPAEKREGKGGGKAGKGDTVVPEVFMKGILNSTTEEDVRKHFESCGKITSVSLPKDKESGKLKGVAFVRFEAEDSIERAVALHGKPFGEVESPIIERAAVIGKGKGKGHTPEVHEAFVKDIPAAADADKVKEYFAKCGDITHFFLPKDKESGKPKGHAFIKFTSAAALDKAIELDGTAIIEDGTYITVEKAMDKGKGKGKDKGKGGKGKGGKGKADKGKGKGKSKRDRK